MLDDPQSRTWKTLSLILVLATLAGFVLLNLLAFDIPFEIPRFLRKAAVVPTALCGAAGFLMLREPGRARSND